MSNSYEPMLCIPRMDVKIDKKFIFNKFCKLKWGFIKEIIEIPLRNDPEQKRVIIKLKWNREEEIQEIKKKIQTGESIKMVYDITQPWFWKIQAFVKKS